MEKTRKTAWGKPTKWNDDRPRQAYELALLGATDKEMAHAMEVDVDTIERWKRAHPEFLQKLNEGKTPIDASVANSLLQCALGYYYIEQHAFYNAKTGEVKVVEIKKYKPREAWAAKQWLSNRRKADWSDTQKLEITQTNINIAKIDLSVLSVEEKLILEKMSIKQLTENAGNNFN
jgi:hypothetical protein